ncbi:MAG: 2TM domain-containing protein [Bacteroidetes bacterium]|nr:2TM domain-containing protein [Bacteroidota bacterium]
MDIIENTNESSYQRAKERVDKLRDFYIHAAIYSIFVIFFIWLNIRSSDFPWAIFPIAGWGLGLLVHASETFEYNIFFGKKWEARKIREMMKEEEEESLRY